MFNAKNRGFTLVELIVIIVILSILATIAFLAFSSQSGNSRDSARLADMSSIKKSLELANINAGSYPKPDYPTSIIYSGGVLWNQGQIGENAYRLLQKNLSKKVVDPLNGNEYDYSVATNKREYQIAGNFENKTSFSRDFNPFGGMPLLSALGGSGTNVYITGNYNGVLLKVFTGSTYFYVPTPTLFGINTSNQPSLIYNSTFSSGTIILPGDNVFADFNAAMVYSTGGSNLSDDDILDLMQTLKNAYSGSNVNTMMVLQLESADDNALADLGAGLITNVLGGTAIGGGSQDPDQTSFTLGQISVGVGSVIGITNDCTAAPSGYTSSNTSVATISGTVITALSAGTTDISPVGGDCGDTTAKTLTVTSLPNSCAAFAAFPNVGPFTTGTPTMPNQLPSYSATPGNCTYTCLNGYSGTNCAIAPLWSASGGGDCTGVDNSVGANGSTSSCNDTRTYTMFGTGAETDRNYRLLKAEGKWWFNENLAYPLATGFKGSNTWSINDMGYYSCPGNNSSNISDCSLVSTGGYLYQWSAATGMSGNLNESLTVQGICPSGWHIPKVSDVTSVSNSYWPTAINAWAGNLVGWQSSYIGLRAADSGGYYGNRGTYEHIITSLDYSASSPTMHWLVYFDKGSPTKSMRTYNNKATGFSVRCVKD